MDPDTSNTLNKAEETKQSNSQEEVLEQKLHPQSNKNHWCMQIKRDVRALRYVSS